MDSAGVAPGMGFRMTDSERYAGEIAYLVRPENQNERVIRAHLDKLLPHAQQVMVGDRDKLLATGSRIGKCHNNCQRYVKPGRQEHVMGWTVTEHLYWAHSVVRSVSDGSLHCVTPDHQTHLREGDFFSFIDDPFFGFCNRGGMVWDDQTTRVDHLDGNNLIVIRRDVLRVLDHYTDIQIKLDAGEITYDQALALGL